MAFDICKWIFDHRDNFINGKLSKEELDKIEKHIKTCEYCRNFLYFYSAAKPAVENIKLAPMRKRRLNVKLENKKRLSNFADNKKNRKTAAVKIIGFAASVTIVLLSGLFFILTAISTSNTNEPAILKNDNKKSSFKNLKESISEAQSSVALPEKQNSIKLQPAKTIAAEKKPLSYKLKANAKISLDSKTKVHIIKDTLKYVKLHLLKGHLVSTIYHSKIHHEFIVETKLANIKATGTIFSVEIKNNGQEFVRVIKNSVKVIPHNKTTSVTIKKGEELIIGNTFATLATEKAIKADLSLANSADDFNKSASPEKRPDSQRLKSAEHQRDDFNKSASPEKRHIKAGNIQTSTKAINAIDNLNFNKVENILNNRQAEPLSAKERINILNRLARRYREAKNYEKSAKTYARLSKEFPKSDAAVNGLVSLAQIEQNSLGNVKIAILHFKQYLKKRPGGILEEAARVGIIRALFRLKKYDEVIKESDKYLAIFSKGVSRHEIINKRAAAANELDRFKNSGF
jgi:tetratricopeptide (TPR) repeat protein